MEARVNPERRWSPTLRRQRLAHTLADLRAQDGRSAAEIAGILGVAKSTVTRMEDIRHLTLPKINLVERLLAVYDADTGTRERVRVLVDEARHRDWWHPYRQLLDPQQITYLGLEAEASILRVFTPVRVPSLLRTSAYHRAVLQAEDPKASTDRLDQLAALHTERTAFMLEGGSPVHLHAILTEAVLRRLVGGREAMREQLEFLLKTGGLDNVVLQVVPDSAGALPLAAPTDVMTFVEPTDPEAIHTTSAAGSHWVEKPDRRHQVEVAFERLVQLGAPVATTRRMIAEQIDAIT